jgi:RND family efflux transporter MFP subunit
MKSFAKWLLVLLAVAAAAGGGYWLGHRGGATAGVDKDDEKSATPDAKPVETVGVAVLRRGTIVEQIVAYGTVVAPPSDVDVVSVPFESRVTKVLVATGQVVSAGQPLAEVEASAGTALAVEEARNALAAAQRDLQLVQQRYDQKLATNSDLFTAQNAQKSTQGRLNSLQQGGAAGPRQLKSETAGIVSKVDVQVGLNVPAGGPLVEIANESRVAVKLGVEPKDAGVLKVGQSVDLTPLDNPRIKLAPGKIRMIGQRVDPATRLVDVIVTPSPDSKLLLESFVSGRMGKPSSSADGLLVPREAVLPDEDGGFTLFTIKDGHAVKHSVKVGIENDREAIVESNDLKEGDIVATVGNYELQDGMAVQLAPALTQPATTQPQTSEPASQTGGSR